VVALGVLFVIEHGAETDTNQREAPTHSLPGCLLRPAAPAVVSTTRLLMPVPHSQGTYLGCGSVHMLEACCCL
jgi:hypothetical protein